MERFEIGRDGPLSEMVDAFERGEQVDIVRDGTVVAHLVAPTPPVPAERRTPRFDPTAWEAVHRLTAPLRDTTGAETIRRLRDMDD